MAYINTMSCREQEDREDRLRSRSAHKATDAGDRSTAGSTDTAGITLKAGKHHKCVCMWISNDDSHMSYSI